MEKTPPQREVIDIMPDCQDLLNEKFAQVNAEVQEFSAKKSREFNELLQTVAIAHGLKRKQWTISNERTHFLVGSPQPPTEPADAK
jgi:hypothetical protein